jgi:uncharacterized membrane protein YidH (DUF202 family)
MAQSIIEVDQTGQEDIAWPGFYAMTEAKLLKSLTNQSVVCCPASTLATNYLWMNSLENNDKDSSDTIILNEVQLLLAEKRTSLAAMRTGIAVIALPLTVMSVLIATSNYYDIFHVMHLLVPLMILSAALVFLGSYLILRSVIRLHRHDRHINELKLRHGRIGGFID